MSDFYRFTRFHRRPSGGPRVAVGFALGHLDGCTFSKQQTHVWSVAEPGWEMGDAEKTWSHLRRVHDSEPWYSPAELYYWQKDPVRVPRHGTPPYGQADIVPVEAPLSVLTTYHCLVFLGWNTMTPELYGKLKGYVRGGGRLVMSLPHLSTQVHRRPELELIHGGDLRDLFGARVCGRGETTESVRFVPAMPSGPYAFPEATLYLEGATLGRVELAGAEVVAESVDLSGPDGLADAGPGQPLLVQHRLGRGFAFLLTTWCYPGPHIPAFLTDVLRTIVNAEQGEIALEGELVSYAVYDDRRSDEPLAVVYAANMSFYGQAQHPRLTVRGDTVPWKVNGHDLRVAWVGRALLVSPADRFVRVDRMRTRKDVCEVSLTAERGSHTIQLAGLGHRVEEVRLDGRAVRPRRDVDGALCVGADLGGAHRLTIRLGKLPA
jgi:hypothetical protein